MVLHLCEIHKEGKKELVLGTLPLHTTDISQAESAEIPFQAISEALTPNYGRRRCFCCAGRVCSKEREK